jgi:hypothetical protein
VPLRPSLELTRNAQGNSRLPASFTSSPRPTPVRLSLNLPTVGTASSPALPAEQGGSGRGVRAIVHGNSVGSRVDAIRNQVAKDAALGSPTSSSGHHHPPGKTGSGGLLDAWHGVSSHNSAHHPQHPHPHLRHLATDVSSMLQGAGGSTGSLPRIPGVPPSASMSAHAGSTSRGTSQPGLHVQFSTLVTAGGSGGERSGVEKRVSFPAERALAHAGGGGGSFQSTGASSVVARLSTGLAAAQVRWAGTGPVHEQGCAEQVLLVDQSCTHVAKAGIWLDDELAACLQGRN